MPNNLGLFCLLIASLSYNIKVAEGGGRIILGRFFGTLNRTNLPFHSKEPKDFPAFWVTQPLDHTNLKDTRTWNQRYFKNETFYKADGPICINIGGEGPVSTYWLIAGGMVPYCSQLNATMYVIEHRFYGESKPLPDTSVKSLKYLTIEQALADLNKFIKYIRVKDNLQSNKVILFGGSYSATLAAYFAEKYDGVACTSVASSAPINWKYDFKEYLEIVGRVINETSPACYNVIKSGMKYLNTAVNTAACHAGQSCSVNLDNLKVCTPLNPRDKLDVENLNNAIYQMFSYYVQYNGQMQTNVPDVCNYLENHPPNSTDFEKLANLVDVMNLQFEEDCLHFSNAGFCGYISETNWEADANKFGARPWTWQVCNEVGAMQSTTSAKQPFGHQVPPAFFAQQCRCAFGQKYTDGFITSNVIRELTVYGTDKRIRPRAIYINGDSDPWSALGIRDKKQLVNKRSNPVLLVKGGSHCSDLLAARPNDSASVINARTETFKYIKYFLDGNCTQSEV